MNGFSKPSFTIEQQISLLRERGLHIPDENRTKRYLSNIGYFRLSDLRNMCAHHSRVWNREFGSRPEMPKKVQTQWPIIAHTLPSPFQNSPEQTISPQRRLYMFVVVMQSLLNVVSPKSRWAERLIDLLDRYPNVSRWHMGFPEDWQSDPFWSRFATSPNKHKNTENSDA